MKFDRFAKYCWILLGYTVLVILWGAFVRATGSGAGCGSHWPTCNGEVIPRSPGLETVIEFTHRLSSGLLGLLTLGLLAGAFRKFPKYSPVRKGAWTVLFFVVSEALVGAGIVRFEWVAANASAARVITVAFHLANTYFLLACLALTAWWASGGEVFAFRGQGKLGRLAAACLAGSVFLGAGGAVTALGDTLARTPGIRAEDSVVVSTLIDARIHHPLSALALGGLLAVTCWVGAGGRWSLRTQRLALGVGAVFSSQLFVGALNVYLKAPVWMQLVHLLFADVFWILLVLLTASALAERGAAGRLPKAHPSVHKLSTANADSAASQGALAPPPSPRVRRTGP